MFASNHFRLHQQQQQQQKEEEQQQPGTRRRRRHRRQEPAMHHCQRASSLKANPSEAAAGVVFLGGCGSSFSDDNSDSGRGEKYRFQERLDLQQQHHKCKSYRRTLPMAITTSSRFEVRDEVGDHSLAENGSGSWQHTCSSYSSSRRKIGRRYWGGLANVFLAAILFLLVAHCPRSGCDDTEQFQKNRKFTPTTATVDTIPARIVWAAVDNDAELPCDITPPGPQDGVKLVLWFKDSTGIPLYSVDSRSGVPISGAQHSTFASDLGQRLFFSVGSTPKEARLQVRNIKQSDGGVYRCRVDYFNSPTRNYRVNLTLVVPPDEPRIFDAQGKEISAVAGPFREGHELFLSCQVSGGRPPPRVSWWHDGVEFSGASHPSAVDGASAMVNQLFIGTVTRELFGAKFVCKAAGSKLVPAVSKEVSIQVHLKPLRVKIVTPNELLTAGRPIPIRCESWGSYPAAKITWLLDGEPLRSADITVHSDNNDANLTSSILMLRVTADNNGAELTCRATNPWFSGAAIEDRRIISVAYEPVVSVHLANEDPSRVITRAEAENVTLKCRADARPPVTSYSWYKNNMRMSGESSETLHLTQLERESAGSYACAASNTEGETRSSSITLKIQYAPRCKPGTEQTSIGSLNMHSLHVRCEVEADPPDGVRFSWTYNNTRNVSPVLNSRISSHGLVSTMTYLPQTDAELVTLACWAMNSVGRQTVPCLIHILPAKIPETPRNCELHNDTVLEVVCQAGSDGGLSQSFLLEVIGGTPPPMFSLDYTRSPPTEIDNEISTMNDQATLAPLFRIQEQQPLFKLHSLEPGRDYQLLVYAVNAKGKSEPPFVIDKVRVGSALIPPYVDETIISEGPTPAETSNADKQKQQSQIVMFAAVAVAIGIILTATIIAGFVTICRLKRPKPPEPQEVRKRMRPARTDVPSMYAEDDVFEDDFQRQAGDPRCSRASSTLRSSRYISEGFVQYSQPSLNAPVDNHPSPAHRSADMEQQYP
ncbi:hemicentin-2 isoform X2 [Toxorhynchites rutilus septentrionalis]|uniref:hemicentin-2 isoform X2 n=1 Tax=Toxorhynchites rutilus septentrionalis TaxID=329112 RepID=UPI00247AB07C|nr:hemicentin-2 isoform X2 [Toxorhynchites rutilus septentrionalis]